MFVQFCCPQRAIRQGKINDLIRKNQINAVRDENRGSKGWWDTV